MVSKKKATVNGFVVDHAQAKIRRVQYGHPEDIEEGNEIPVVGLHVQMQLSPPLPDYLRLEIRADAAVLPQLLKQEIAQSEYGKSKSLYYKLDVKDGALMAGKLVVMPAASVTELLGYVTGKGIDNGEAVED